MSIEGGVFTCYEHQYETYSVKKWDSHMHDIEHPTLEVSQQCMHCKEWNVQHGLLHPERFVERMHSNKPEDQNVIVLKCQFCNKLCK